MSTFDTLPVILVSAISETAATSLISELIDNDVTDDYVKDHTAQSLDRVWKLVNKYYTVDVRVHALSDHGRLEVDPGTIEAHVIHMTEEELVDAPLAAARAEARAASSGGAWRRAGVRLLLAECAHESAERALEPAECAHEPAALAAWARRQRADLVALRDAAGDAAEPFAEGGGLQRARAALHAHVWPGLVRTDRAARLPPPEVSGGSSCASSDDSACSDESDSEAEERRAVEQAEAFAAALGALGPALAARSAPVGPLGPALAARPAPAGPPAGPPDLRRDQAEALVLAFCRALGLEPDAC